jgi:ubiquinone/menaquinone biosynthesis C-methylase UbiE
MAYAISEQNLERQRLFANVIRSVTDRLLEHLPVPSGSRCLDLGCGIGETTRQLAEKLNNVAELIGVDQDSNLIDVARSALSAEGSIMTFRQGDAAHLEFEDETFDFVFARYLLHHLDHPQAVLAEMLRVCKSGGIVAVQEPDCAKQYCYPESWAYERIPEIYGRVFANPFIGRQLYSLFQQLGYPSPHLDVTTLAGVNVELRRSYRMVMEAIGPALTEKGILESEELEEMCKELRRVEKQKDVLCVWSPTFSVWVNRT